MAAVAYLDTHVVAWLYAGRTDLLSEDASRILRDRDLLISPMVRLELQYLYEVGRVATGARAVMQSLAGTIALKVCDRPFATIAERAERESWTRDPFDRIIVAHAAFAEATLVTKDTTIHQHYSLATW